MDGGFEARAIGAAIFTEADSIGLLREAVREAVAVHFDEEGRPLVIRLHFVREEILLA